MLRIRVITRTMAAFAVAALAASGLAPLTAAAAPAGATAPSHVSRADDPIAHDPTIAKEGKYFYLVITGDSATHTYLPIKRSRDLVHWENVGPVFTTLPTWVTADLGVTPADAWAPDLTYVNGLWRLYYAASQFGTQNSVIGLATTPTLDPTSPNYGWTDRGLVLRSTPGVDDFNAIDPEFARDGEGNQWLAFGSFWGGIKMRRLDPATGKPSAADPTVYSLASRVAPDAEEGASIIRHGGYYYLFLSFDFCCRGVNSDYREMVGRSRSITGPYVDAAGVPLTSGGGTEVLRGYNEFIGPGGADTYSLHGVDLFVNHYYDATDNGAPKLNVRTLEWRGGWPTVSDPLNPSVDIGHGDAYVRILERNSELAVADAGCGYEGANIDLEAPSSSTCQQWQFYYRGNGVYSVLNRFSNKIAELGACNNVEGGNVSQWGWIGFLPNNDCQRWTPVSDPGGWTTVRSILPGSRVWSAAGCGKTPGTNVDIESASATACQQFRFEPEGDVLIAGPTANGETLGVAGCVGHVALTRVATFQPRRPWGCQEWTFHSAGGAAYVVTNADTGLMLAMCARGATDRLCVQRRGDVQQLWTVQPQADGTWALTNVDGGSATNVRLLIP